MEPFGIKPQSIVQIDEMMGCTSEVTNTKDSREMNQYANTMMSRAKIRCGRRH
jgi:hypothetical protein